MIINCPDCHMPVTLTKHGRISRHGWRGYHSNIRGIGWRKLKSQCTGSGKNLTRG